jgi:4-amino-4-deoxy-L-arabinose transferase-like glycosyltransferase
MRAVTMTQRLRSRFGTLKIDSGYQYWILAAITLFAAFLRLYNLGEWSFWLDEISTVRRAQVHGTLKGLLQVWWQPSISLLLTSGALRLFGVSEWSARLASAVIGILSVPILFFPIKRLFGPRVGLLSALLLAVAPWHIYWSQNARFYTSLMLFYALASFAFFQGIERDRPACILFFAFLLFLAQGERLIGFFLVPVVICYLLLLGIAPYGKPPGLRARNIVLILVPGLALGIYQVYQYVETGSFYFAHAIDTFAGRPIDSPSRILILIAFNIGIPLASLAIFSGVYGLLRKDRRALFLFVGAVVPPLLLAAVNPFAFTVARFVFTTLPCWIILAAMGVDKVFSWARGTGRVLAAGIVFLLLADAAGQHLMYYSLNHGNRPDWRKAFAFVVEKKRNDDVLVSSVPLLGSYYTKQEVIWLGDIEPAVITQGSQRFWFVLDSENSWWSGREKQWVEENCQLVEAWYLRMREDMHLRVYVCDPARSQHRSGTALNSLAIVRPRI